MARKKPLSIAVCRAVRRALSGVAIVSTAAAIPSMSQAQNAPEAAPVTEVVVTGSRIAVDPNIAASSPVTQIKAEEIITHGVTRVEDLINDLPQVTPEFTANDSNGATGTATLDLRALGSDRTLVLTNGHRMGFGDPFQLAPDVNQVPGQLIDRVEILTGGASSTYGSDAIAGVVNFVMKRDFQGFQINYQYSGNQHHNHNKFVQNAVAARGFDQAPGHASDGTTKDVNLVIGTNTEDGNGNITGYLGYREINAVLQAQRDFSACALSSSNGVRCGGSATSPTGLFTDFDHAYFTVSGNDFVEGVPLYNYGPLNYFERPDKRYTAGLFGHYEVSKQLEGYSEVQFMDDRSVAQIAPSGAFFVTSTLNCDNPYLSAQQIQAINDAGYPCGPGLTVPFYIGRRNVEGGPRFDDLRHTSYRILGGARGEITPNWSYDVSANYARLVYAETYNNDMSITRIGRALDVVTDPATGQPTCRSVLEGSDPSCVPWNVFQTGGVTREAINYLTLPLFSRASLDQDQYVAYVTGDLGGLGVKSPWAEEGLQVVLGGEYRGQRFDFNPDQGFTSGDGAGQGGSTVGVFGTLNVKEYFTELRVPVAEDRPAIKSLTLELRYRYSDYDTGVTSNTYNFNTEWTPVQGLKFRGGYSRAVRAANIRELFEPQNFGLWSGTDPCAGATPLLPAAQCANTGVTAAQYGAIPLSPAGQYNGVFGGNPNLEPEKSDSYTAGVVFNAEQWVSGLQFSVDYWRIKVKDAIDSVDPETIVRQCGATGDATLCGLINRGPNGNLWIGGANVVSTNVNIGFFNTAGVDIAANYRMQVGSMGSLSFNLVGTRLNKYDQQEIPGNPIDDCSGKWGGACGRPRPKYKHVFTTSWTTPWNLSLTGSWRHVGAIDEFSTDAAAYDASARDYLDLAGIYKPQWRFGKTTLNVGVTNVLDKDPPVNGRFGNVAVYGNGNTIPGTWDVMGRYYFLGVTQQF